MDARTTPFTRMHGLAAAYRADTAMLASLEQGDSAADRLLGRLLRALGHEPVGSVPCMSLAPSDPSSSS